MGKSSVLRFAFWPVEEAVVRDNVQRFTRKTGIAVAAEAVGGDYHTRLGTAFAAGGGPDVFYAQRAEAAEWAACGFLAPIDEGAQAVASCLGAMDKRFVEAARDAEGRLLGLTYYAGGPLAVFVRPGVSLGAQSWDGFLAELRALQRGGMAHPFVPRWHATQTGLVWSLLAHLATEGVRSLDAADALPAMREGLAVWQALVRERLVPPESLDDPGDAAAVARWATGDHAATFTVDYIPAVAAGIAARPVSQVAERLPGRTGTPLMPGHALLCVRAGLSDARRAAAVALSAFLGGPEVHRRWAREAKFFTAYPEVHAEPETRVAIARPFDGPAAVERLERVRATAVTSPVVARPGALAWSARADAILRGWLRGERDGDAASVARGLLAAWGDARH